MKIRNFSCQAAIRSIICAYAMYAYNWQKKVSQTRFPHTCTDKSVRTYFHKCTIILQHMEHLRSSIKRISVFIHVSAVESHYFKPATPRWRIHRGVIVIWIYLHQDLTKFEIVPESLKGGPEGAVWWQNRRLKISWYSPLNILSNSKNCNHWVLFFW